MVIFALESALIVGVVTVGAVGLLVSALVGVVSLARAPFRRGDPLDVVRP